jgi:tetraacyldisaccharide 4'-kinase
MAESPLPRALRFLGPPASAVYAIVMARRNRAFDAGRGVVEIDRPVISIGNLTLGGTGKTPLVKKVVRELRGAGWRPAIAMRGYAAKAGFSDEAAEYAAALEDVPVVAQANRLEGLLDLFATPEGKGVDAVVLDDGFQHRRIARQLDIVLIDASKDPLRDRVFPAGTLREPLESLARADWAVITHAETVRPTDLDALVKQLAAIGGGIPIAIARHAWSSLRVIDRGAEREEPVAWLRGKRVVAACGIGNPAAFIASVKAATASNVEEFVRPDHDPFSVATTGALLNLAQRSAAAAIVVTAKDWAKLRRVKPDAWPCPVVIPQLDLAFDRGWDELREAVLNARTEDIDE